MIGVDYYNGTLDESYTLFTTIFMDLVKSHIPNKKVTIRLRDKPWYDSEIRKFSDLRNRIKFKAIKSSKESNWTKYKHLRNKVDNLKNTCKGNFL